MADNLVTPRRLHHLRRGSVFTLIIVLALAGIGPVGLSGSVGVASAQTPITGCTIIDEPGEYVLTTDIMNATSRSCIRIGADNVVFDGAGHTIDGREMEDLPFRGVFVTGRENVTVTNVVVSDWQEGIWYQGQSGRLVDNILVDTGIHVAAGSEDTVISNNTIGIGGIQIKQHSSRIIVENNTISTFSRGVAAHNAEGVVIANNTIVGGVATPEPSPGSRSGIYLFGTDDSTVSDNTVSNIHFGITIRGDIRGDNNLIQRNVLRDNLVGINIRDAGNNNTVTDNTVIGNAVGIRVQWAGNTITNNTVSDNRLGIHLRSTGTRNNTLRNNIVVRNDLAGIRVGRLSQGNVIASNTIRSNGGSGIRLHDATDNTLVNNTVANNSYGIFLSASDNNTLAGNNATGNRFDGIRLVRSNGTNLDANTVEDNRFGVRLVSSSHTTLSDTVATRNELAGVRVVAESWTGRGSAAVNNVLENTSATANGVSGIRLVGGDRTALRGTTVSDNAFGVWLASSDNTTLMRTTATNNRQYALVSGEGSARTVAEHFTLGANTTVAFRATDVALRAVTSPPPAPDGYANVSQHVGVTFSGLDGRIALNVSYDDADVPADVDESTLALWRYDGTWTRVPGSEVNVNRNYVYGNVTTPGIVAPLGEETNGSTASS